MSRVNKKVHTSPPPPPSRPTYFIGIDPGEHGGLACIKQLPNEDQGIVVALVKMFDNNADLLKWLSGWSMFDPYVAFERNTGYVGGAGNPGSSMFNFGINTGRLDMALTICGYDLLRVDPTPRQWQSKLQIPGRKKGEDKGVWKSRLLAHASKLFPTHKITLSTADALLLAEYARLVRLDTDDRARL